MVSDNSLVYKGDEIKNILATHHVAMELVEKNEGCQGKDDRFDAQIWCD